MTVQAKQQLIGDIEDDIGEYLTAVNTKRVVKSVTDKLTDYNVELIRNDFTASDDDVLKAFIEAKTVEGRSEKTITRYSYMLEKMIAQIGKPVAKIDSFDVRSFLSEERKRGLSGRSLEGMRMIMSGFFNWATREGLINKNPMANIGAIKYKKDIKTPFSALEIEKIKRACKTARDRALVDFLTATGCRIGEVCKLTRDSVDFQNMEVLVLGKGNKERVVYLTEVAADSLRTYLDSRSDHSDQLFAGKREMFTEQGCRALLKRLERDSGVENVHPHRFRRTLATNLINRGMALQEVAYVLGHSNINTTMTYVYIEKANVKASYQKYSD